MASILERTAREPDRVLRYSEAPTGVIDMYAGGSATIVLLVHGGFWRSRYDRKHLRPLAAALSEHGMLVALPEYRRVGNPGGGWPGTAEDIVYLTRHIRQLAQVPDARLVIAGHSAGGHLAMLAAAAPETHVDKVVALAGVLDVGAAVRDRLSDGAASEFVGESPIADADPMALPLPRTEIALVHGRHDTEVPVDYSRRFAERHPSIRLETPECGHYELIDPEASEFPLLLAAIV